MGAATSSLDSVRFAPRSAFAVELQANADAYFAGEGGRRRDLPLMYLKSAIILAWFVASWALIGDAAETYDLTNIGTLFAFMLVSIGVLVLRYKEPERLRPFRVPLVWPVCLLSAAGCVFIMYGLPRTAWERFGIWLVIGLVLYFAYGYSHSKLRQQA